MIKNGSLGDLEKGFDYIIDYLNFYIIWLD